MSMIGITDMAFVNLGKNGIYAGASEDVITNNNFLGCTNLKYLVVNKAFNLFKDSPDAQQFVGDAKCIDLYVLGFETESNVMVIGGKGNNGLLSGNIYYKVDDTAEVKCGQWKLENGEIVHGAAAHNFVDGKCEHCGEYNTQGVVYEYDATNNCYYVGNNKTLNLFEVTILDEFNDGIHGKKAVKYVAAEAFKGNAAIKTIILSDSVDSLEGRVFWGCENLEYVSMTGITNLEYASPYGGGRNNNFRECFKLKVVIVSNALSSNVGQFGCGAADTGNQKILDFYVAGASGAPSLDYETADANNLCSGNVYYYSDTEVSGCWHYDENGMPTLWN